jgi:two-component system sensor histidine kinase KdpD
MNQNDPPTEHILACLSSSPSNAKIVRTAATMAKAFGGTFTALYVRTPDSDQMGKEDRRRLQQHIRMAEQAGADISTIYGDDIPQQIAEFARISGITKIVLGRSSVHRRHFWSGPSLTEKLTMTAPNLDIYIIPDASAENGYGSGRKLFIRPFLPSVRDLLITAGILSCITLIGFLFLQLDPDAKEYAINLALKLVAYKKVKVVFLPDGKDVNDLGRSQTLKLVYATRYQSYQKYLLKIVLSNS